MSPRSCAGVACLVFVHAFAALGCQRLSITPADLSVFETAAAKAQATPVRLPIDLGVVQLQLQLQLQLPQPQSLPMPLEPQPEAIDRRASDFTVIAGPSERARERAAELFKSEAIASVLVLSRGQGGDDHSTAELLLAEARKRNASLLLVFTLGGQSSHEYVPLIGPLLDLLTFGYFPAAVGTANIGAQALLIDTRSGFIYGRYEVRRQEWKLANRYTLMEAEHKAFFRCLDRASIAVIDAFERDWARVVEDDLVVER